MKIEKNWIKFNTNDIDIRKNTMSFYLPNKVYINWENHLIKCTLRMCFS